MSARNRRFPWFREGHDQYAHETCQHEPIMPNSFFCKKCGEDFSNVKVYNLGGKSGYENIFMPDPVKSAKPANPTIEDKLKHDVEEILKLTPLNFGSQNMAYMYSSPNIFTMDTLFRRVDHGKEEKVTRKEVQSRKKVLKEGLSKLLPSKKR